MSGSNVVNNEMLFYRVLLVEDDPSHSLLIQRALEPLTEQVDLVRTVADASKQIEAEHFDLVITDLSLPDSDGVSHVRSFQELQPGLPVVILTVTTRIEDVVAAMRFGAKDFILKSFESDFRELIRLALTRVYSALQIEEERRKMQMVIENSDEALALLDQSGKVRYSNRAFSMVAERCGGDRSDLLSLFTENVANSDSLIAQVEKKLGELVYGGLWSAELQLVGESTGAYSLTLSGLEPGRQGEAQKKQEIVAWLRDISELKRREKFQRELISTTTHDLKGPMGAIITGAELVSDLVQDNDKASKIILRVQSAAHGVVNLIDEFLSAKRIEDGSLILKPSEQKVGRLFEDVKANFQTIAESRSIDLVFDLDEDDTVMVDKMGFLRVMGNLLSNALKFTPKGSVSVTAKTQPSGTFRIEVSDTGSGIEPGELKRIFDRYARLDRHQEVSGSGIGLFVVKSIVEAHGGALQVESIVGTGTTFLVEFPANPPVNDRGELISLDFAE